MTHKVAKYKSGSSTAAKAVKPGFQANIENGKGYFDLVANLNANGKAVRIADKYNENRIHVTLDSIPSLIAALKDIQTQKVKTSVEALQFQKKTA